MYFIHYLTEKSKASSQKFEETLNKIDMKIGFLSVRIRSTVKKDGLIPQFMDKAKSRMESL